LHEIWQAETREDAVTAFDTFLEKYDAKYHAACNCLLKDKTELLTFYDFPAEHWAHLRTTNPIESTFATIRLRHKKTKGSGSRRTSLAMMFKLAQSAGKKWHRLRSYQKIAFAIEGRSFKDVIMQDKAQSRRDDRWRVPSDHQGRSTGWGRFTLVVKCGNPQIPFQYAEGTSGGVVWRGGRFSQRWQEVARHEASEIYSPVK